MVEKYRPSNGTEGECFQGAWCSVCEHDRLFREDEKDPCSILGKTFIYNVSDDQYPKEWCYDDNGNAVCTAFVQEGKEIPYKCSKTGDMFDE